MHFLYKRIQNVNRLHGIPYLLNGRTLTLKWSRGGVPMDPKISFRAVPPSSLFIV